MKIKLNKRFLIEDLNKDDLIIINIQPDIKNRIYFDLKKFGEWVKGNSFNKIFFFYNGDSNQEPLAQIGKWYTEYLGIDLEQDLDVKQGNSNVQDIFELKEYFDKILDTNYKDEDIITLGKYMLHKNYDKIENMMPEDIESLDINPEFKTELIEGKHKLYIPYDTLNILKSIKNTVILVGGLNHSSLRIFKILCEIAKVEYQIEENWTY